MITIVTIMEIVTLQMGNVYVIKDIMDLCVNVSDSKLIKILEINHSLIAPLINRWSRKS